MLRSSNESPIYKIAVLSQVNNPLTEGRGRAVPRIPPGSQVRTLTSVRLLDPQRFSPRFPKKTSSEKKIHQHINGVWPNFRFEERKTGSRWGQGHLKRRRPHETAIVTSHRHRFLSRGGNENSKKKGIFERKTIRGLPRRGGLSSGNRCLYQRVWGWRGKKLSGLSWRGSFFFLNRS